MIAGLFVLLVIGVPIGLSLIAIGAAGLFAIRGIRGAPFLLETVPYASTASLALIVIPLFVFIGHLAYSAGLSQKAYRAAKTWVGHIAGGLPIATVFACAGFATVCGSSVATAATVARIAVPEMLKAGFNQKISGGCVSAAGALGILIPPSGILVIYSIATNVSIADLFIGAIAPGILTAVVYAVGIHLIVRRDPELVARTRLPPAPWPARFKDMFNAWEMLSLFLVIIGGIYLGLATATESAALGAALALGIAVARGGLRDGTVRAGLIASASSTASIFLLIVGSALFGVALASTQIPTLAASWVAAQGLPPTLLLLLLLVPYLFLGCFIDGISMIFLTMPVVFPVIQTAGINPVLFGIIVTKLVEIGAITPPVGMNVFVVSGAVPGLRMTEVFRGAVPFIIMEILVIGLLIAFPQIVTFPLAR